MILWPHQIAALLWGTFFLIWGICWLINGKWFIALISFPVMLFFYGTLIKEYFYGW